MCTIYYDSHCKLCLKSKEFIERMGKPRATWLDIFSSEIPFTEKEKNEGIIVSVNKKWFRGYDAVIEIISQCLGGLRVVPRIMRIPVLYHIGKALYVVVAKNRKHFFGTCDRECHL